MSNLSLFYIQDDDRPMFVLAENYHQALKKWEQAIIAENKEDDPTLEDDGVPSPLGIQFVANPYDIIL